MHTKFLVALILCIMWYILDLWIIVYEWMHCTSTFNRVLFSHKLVEINCKDPYNYSTHVSDVACVSPLCIYDVELCFDYLSMWDDSSWLRERETRLYVILDIIIMLIPIIPKSLLELLKRWWVHNLSVSFIPRG